MHDGLITLEMSILYISVSMPSRLSNRLGMRLRYAKAPLFVSLHLTGQNTPLLRLAIV